MKHRNQTVSNGKFQGRCEQFAQSCYLVADWLEVELGTSWSWIQRPIHRAIKPSVPDQCVKLLYL